jgi:hypothetical protein
MTNNYKRMGIAYGENGQCMGCIWICHKYNNVEHGLCLRTGKRSYRICGFYKLRRKALNTHRKREVVYGVYQ